MRDDEYIVSASADSELRVWKISDAKDASDGKENQTLVGEDDCTSKLVSLFDLSNIL